ncbi:MAG: carboxypeptidase regulatory-like domain-containing protein [Bacteroidetes bacterium]|nr:carboxypeptidase regulatory-like domain-containing protein [Bacteroidota bacterium]
MNSQQEARFNMFGTVAKVGTDNSTFIATIPELQNGFNTNQTVIATLSGLASLQAQVINGIAIDKKDLKKVMATFAFNYSGPGRAWAAKLGNDEIFQALNISISKIRETLDGLAAPIAQNMYNISNANAATLIPFGLTAAMLGELLASINDYTAIVPLTGGAINNRQTYTQNIDDVIKKHLLFLERQLDSLVVAQSNANPDFVSTYKNSREIIDPPKHSTTFKILVLEQTATPRTTQPAPIEGAKVQAVNTAKVAFTDASGNTELKEFRKGIYSILVTSPNHTPVQQDNISIGLGQTKTLTFSLPLLTPPPPQPA